MASAEAGSVLPTLLSDGDNPDDSKPLEKRFNGSNPAIGYFMSSSLAYTHVYPEYVKFFQLEVQLSSGKMDEEYDTWVLSIVLDGNVKLGDWIPIDIATMAGTAFFPREENILIAVMFVCMSAFIINLPCISVLALFGASIKKYINNHLLKKIIEYFFSFLLVLTGIYLVI